jgi:rhodanese-related sulfurtransferase
MLDMALSFRQCLALLLTIALSGYGTAAAMAEHPATVSIVTVEEARALQETEEDLLIIDIRTGFEYRRGHLKEAILINYYLPGFKKKLDALPKDRPVLYYCHSGVRSGKSERIFEELGFLEVYHLKAGWRGWKAAELPYTKD